MNKRCPACGSTVKESAIFCEKCGYQLVEYTNYESEYNTDREEEPADYKKIAVAILVPIAIMITIVLGIIGYFYISVNKSNDNNIFAEEESNTEITKDEADYSVYNDIIQSASEKNYRCTYYFTDIDGNGVKELFLDTGNNSAEHLINIYTIEKDNALLVGNTGGHTSIHICENGEVYEAWMQRGAYHLSQIHIENNALKKVDVLTGDYESFEQNYDPVVNFLLSKGEITYQTETIYKYDLSE